MPIWLTWRSFSNHCHEVIAPAHMNSNGDGQWVER